MYCLTPSPPASYSAFHSDNSSSPSFERQNGHNYSNSLPTIVQEEQPSPSEIMSVMKQALDVLKDSTIASKTGKDDRSHFWGLYKRVVEEHGDKFLERYNGDVDIDLSNSFNDTVRYMDKEKLVRDQGFKVVELFIKRLEARALTMPETASTEHEAGLADSATGAAAALTGWAVSSLSEMSAPAGMQTTVSSIIDAPISAPNINGRASFLPVSSASPSANPSRSKAYN
ncbi:hypothetical protein EV424DRAFT_1534193 [Suillus variegatus]|nr:hypothetical protein EV424DRAFT_1534189 [Suillus variegatus]KAG1831514.1 hypothetical protein EV424DRAFT_1534193 [Suillus variegatus]